MNNKLYQIALIALIANGIVLATASTVHAQQDLAGRMFVIKGTYVFSLIPDLPVGGTFTNCYTFNEDGSWDDPLFPDPATPIPGTWQQFPAAGDSGEGRKINYTAVVDGTGGLVLVQHGKLGKNGKLVAYSALTANGAWLVEVKSKGREVEVCP